MDGELVIRPIAHIESPFQTKFGVPRQSGITENIASRIIFEPEYRDEQAFRGLEGFSHLWLIWNFSQIPSDGWSATVRPPKLGGNKRVGVFATRSPFRPNHLGLSCVRIKSICFHTPDGPVIEVTGADLIDGTPIFDVKPYIPYTDSRPEALGGFALSPETDKLDVMISDNAAGKLPQELLRGLSEALAQDPRPAYQNDGNRIYKMVYAGFEISFRVSDGSVMIDDAEPFGMFICQ